VDPRALSPAVTPTDPEGSFVETGRGPVFVVDEGPKDAAHVLFLVHGVPGSTRDFRYLGPALATSGIRAIRVDLPGFGRTPMETSLETHAKNRAALVVRLADLMGVPRFGVVAHSYGGSLALLAAANFPTRVRALVLLASIGVLRHRVFPILPAPVFAGIARALETSPVDEPLRTFVQKAYAALGLQIDVPAHVLAHWTRVIAATDFAAHRAAARTIECPTLLVSADDDPLVEPRIHLDLAARLDARGVPVRHLKFSRGGHFVQKTHARHVADAVVEMLDHHHG